MEAMSPIIAFRFHVAFSEQPLASGGAGQSVPMCSGAFSECSGLEATMEPKVIKEGGRNYGDAQRVGKVTFSTVVLKRGLTSNRDLWRWFELVNPRAASSYRLGAVITVLGPEGGTVQWAWELRRCLPVKFKAPDLSAQSAQVAIEELHLAHEGLVLLDASSGLTPGFAGSASSSGSLSAGVSLSASASISASASLNGSGSFSL